MHRTAVGSCSRDVVLVHERQAHARPLHRNQKALDRPELVVFLGLAKAMAGPLTVSIHSLGNQPFDVDVLDTDPTR